MPGIILPNGQETTSGVVIKIPARDPEDMARTIDFMLPTPTSVEMQQRDTDIRVGLNVLNELLNVRMLLASMNEHMMAMRAATEQLAHDSKLTQQNARLHNTIGLLGETPNRLVSKKDRLR